MSCKVIQNVFADSILRQKLLKEDLSHTKANTTVFSHINQNLDNLLHIPTQRQIKKNLLGLQ